MLRRPQPAGGRRALSRSRCGRSEGSRTKRKGDLSGLGALRIPLGLAESEAAAVQLCSLGCVSGGARDPEPAHSFCESLGPPAEAAVKCRNGVPRHSLGNWGSRWERPSQWSLFTPDVWILKLTWVAGPGDWVGTIFASFHPMVAFHFSTVAGK